MITKTDIVEYEIPDKVLLYAEKMARVSDANYNSQTIVKSNQGRLVGFISELIFKAFLLKGKIAHQWMNSDPNTPSFDYDFLVDGRRVDVKSKDRTVPVRLDYEASVAAYQHQSCDIYIFMSLWRQDERYAKAYILGYLTKEEFLRRSIELKKGEVDKRNNYVVRKDCRNIEYSKLQPICQLHVIE